MPHALTSSYLLLHFVLNSIRSSRGGGEGGAGGAGTWKSATKSGVFTVVGGGGGVGGFLIMTACGLTRIYCRYVQSARYPGPQLKD